MVKKWPGWPGKGIPGGGNSGGLALEKEGLSGVLGTIRCQWSQIEGIINIIMR